MSLTSQLFARSRQTVVYWVPGNADQYGRPAYGQPVLLVCRWEDAMHEVINAAGENVMSSSRVLLPSAVLNRGLLMLGTLADVADSSFPADPKADSRVHEIVNSGAVPSINAAETMYEAHVV